MTINPFESPKSPSDEDRGWCLPPFRVVLVAFVRLELLGALIGACLGVVACLVLSGGRSAAWFYGTYALLGTVAGLAGAVPAGIAIAVLRAVSLQKPTPREE